MSLGKGRGMNKHKRGFMFIEPLLVVAIIMFVFFQLFKIYFKKPAINKDAQKFIAEQGVDATNYKTITDTAKKQIQDLQAQYTEKLKQAEEMK
jgi:competence protein ComGC